MKYNNPSAIVMWLLVGLLVAAVLGGIAIGQACGR